jgi:hypothetical protein
LEAAVDNTGSNLIPNCCSPKAPVAYIVFNRPRHTRETFAAIRNYRPSKLFIIADALRTGHPGDIERCREVRSIVSAVDWPCEVFRDFSESNLGAGARVSSGLDWVFSKVDRALVLEDWPAPGSEDTELGVLMELEVGHGETEVYPRVQA